MQEVVENLETAIGLLHCVEPGYEDLDKALESIREAINRLKVTPYDVLNCKMGEDDYGESYTIRDELCLLLTTLWAEGECFSGKRSLGDSGWQNKFYAALAKEGLLAGKWCEADGEATDYDKSLGFQMILDAIIYMGKK